jgi:hypothetical protein
LSDETRLAGSSLDYTSQDYSSSCSSSHDSLNNKRGVKRREQHEADFGANESSRAQEVMHMKQRTTRFKKSPFLLRRNLEEDLICQEVSSFSLQDSLTKNYRGK